MPDYKRKKVKKPFARKKPHINREKKSATEPKRKQNIGVVPENDIKVVRGKKFKRVRKIKILSAVAAILIVVTIVLSFTLPVSLYENFVNFFARIGSGSYPISISGSSVLNTVSGGSYYYVLTDTNIAAYSNSGKIIFDELHGFANPIISVSDTRVLVYDQGGNSVFIYNLGGKIHALETESKIITASISRDGDFAIATHAEGYASSVNVYDKKANKLYTWNSAKDIVNNVLVDAKGKKLAVTTLNATSGKYITKLLILNFKSADPLHTLELDGSLPLSLKNTGKGISVICNDKYKFVNWSDYNTKEITASGEINLFRGNGNNLLLVFNRANDRSDNTVFLVSKSGEKVTEFKINSAITDIQYKNGRVYLVNDTVAVIYDKKGNLLKKGECEYGAKKIAVVASNAVALITDNEILRTKIDK